MLQATPTAERSETARKRKSRVRKHSSTPHMLRHSKSTVFSKKEGFCSRLPLTVEWMVAHAESTSWAAKILHVYKVGGLVDAMNRQCASRDPPFSKICRRGQFRKLINFTHLSSVNAR
jgi:hypothetical protein